MRPAATGTLKGHRVAGHLVDLDYPVSFFVARGMRPGRSLISS